MTGYSDRSLFHWDRHLHGCNYTWFTDSLLSCWILLVSAPSLLYKQVDVTSCEIYLLNEFNAKYHDDSNSIIFEKDNVLFNYVVYIKTSNLINAK